MLHAALAMTSLHTPLYNIMCLKPQALLLWYAPAKREYEQAATGSDERGHQACNLSGCGERHYLVH